MRHRAAAFRAAGIPVDYLRLGEHPHARLSDAVEVVLGDGDLSALVMLEPGDYRLQELLVAAVARAGKALLLRPDPHFLCSLEEFAAWAGDKTHLRMEFFYRWQRKRHRILMDGDQPSAASGIRRGQSTVIRQARPRRSASTPALSADAVTQGAIADVEEHFPGHPGETRSFSWAVTSAQAEEVLADFIRHRLPEFGRWQDAMWRSEPFLWHSLLSSALNLKLIDPRRVIDATLAAYEAGDVPIAAAEGFIRQILGWREFVRGVYWRQLPLLASANQYDHRTPLPAWFWTGETRAACLADSVRQTLEHGYAHHIQRLMITGNFALIAGLAPRQVADCIWRSTSMPSTGWKSPTPSAWHSTPGRA